MGLGSKGANKSFKCKIIYIIFIFIFALFLRLKMAGIFTHTLSHDAINYDAMARQFLDSGVLGYMSQKPNAYVTPGYPLFLSAIYIAFGYATGSPLTQVRIIQAVLGAITCVLILGIAEKTANFRTGVLASILVTIYPTFVWAPSLILTEVFYTFLFVLYIYIQMFAMQKKTKMLYMLSGVIFALAVLVRPLIFPLFFVPFVIQYFKTRDKDVLIYSMSTVAGIVLIMLPWWIRNYTSLNKVVILATQTGNPLIAGTFPYFSNIDYSRYQVENQVKEALRLIWTGITSNPILYFKWYTVGKFEYIFGRMWLDMPPEITFMRSFGFFHYYIVVMGWMGVLLTFVKKKFDILFVLLIMLTIMQFVFVPEPRYAYPLIPLLTIFAAYLTNYIFWNSKELTGSFMIE